MVEFARVWTDGKVFGDIAEYRVFADAPPDTSRKGFVWLPVERSTSGSGPVAGAAVTTILADKVTIVTPLREKTAEEVAAENDAKTNSVADVVFKVLLNHENRVRALEGKATITGAQFKAALKALL